MGVLALLCVYVTCVLRRDDVLGELLDRLAAMGIEPLGAIDRAPSLVEKRLWKPPDANGNGKDDAKEAVDAAIRA